MAAFIFHLSKNLEKLSVYFPVCPIATLIFEIHATALVLQGHKEMFGVIKREVPVVDFKKKLKENYAKFAVEISAYTIEAWLRFVFFNTYADKFSDVKLERIRNLLNKEFPITQNMIYDEAIDLFCDELDSSAENRSGEAMFKMFKKYLLTSCSEHLLAASRCCTLKDLEIIESMAIEIVKKNC